MSSGDSHSTLQRSTHRPCESAFGGADSGGFPCFFFNFLPTASVHIQVLSINSIKAKATKKVKLLNEWMNKRNCCFFSTFCFRFFPFFKLDCIIAGLYHKFYLNNGITFMAFSVYKSDSAIFACIIHFCLTCLLVSRKLYKLVSNVL